MEHQYRLDSAHLRLIILKIYFIILLHNYIYNDRMSIPTSNPRDIAFPSLHSNESVQFDSGRFPGISRVELNNAAEHQLYFRLIPNTVACFLWKNDIFLGEQSHVPSIAFNFNRDWSLLDNSEDRPWGCD